MKKSKKILAGVLATASMMSCMAMPTMAAGSPTCSGSANGVSYTGRASVYSDHGVASTTASNPNMGIEAYVKFTSIFGEDVLVSENRVSGTTGIQTAVAFSKGGRAESAYGQHAGVGWSDTTIEYY